LPDGAELTSLIKTHNHNADCSIDFRPQELDRSVLSHALELQGEILAIRRTIHANPELAYREFATAGLAAGRLEGCGFRIIQHQIAGSGFYAELGSGQAIALRAGMDAQPLAELNQIVWRSRFPDVMHACGHDAGVAVVLGAAKILAARNFRGCLRVIMQPAEEGPDKMGCTGSAYMIKAGALENLKAILGLHLDATLPAGRIGVVNRPVAELACKFSIKLSASSRARTDCAELAFQLIFLLKELRRQELWQQRNMEILELNASSEKKQIALSGSFCAGTALLACLQSSLADACRGAFKSDFDLEVVLDECASRTHKSVLDTVMSAAAAVAGDSLVGLARRTWTKDFANYARLVPSAFFLVGTEVPGKRTVHHSANFDIDESVLPLAAAVLAQSALALLDRQS
jgi:IAA-amino acid hydrolase